MLEGGGPTPLSSNTQCGTMAESSSSNATQQQCPQQPRSTPLQPSTKSSSLASSWCRQSPPPGHQARHHVPNVNHPNSQSTKATFYKRGGTNVSNHPRLRQLRSNPTITPGGSRKHKILGANLSTREKGFRQNQANHQPERTEQVLHHQKTQRGNVERCNGKFGTPRKPMGHDNRFEKLVPPPQNQQETGQVDEVQVQGQHLSSHCNALWLEQQPLVVNQAQQTNQGLDEPNDVEAQLVGRRHTNSGTQQNGDRIQGLQINQSLDQIGHSSQQGEEHAGGKPKIHILGSSSGSDSESSLHPIAQIDPGTAHGEAPDERSESSTKKCGQPGRQPLGPDEEQLRPARTSTAIDVSNRRSPATECETHTTTKTPPTQLAPCNPQAQATQLNSGRNSRSPERTSTASVPRNQKKPQDKQWRYFA